MVLGALACARGGDSIGDFYDLNNFGDIVNAYDVRAAQNRSRYRRCGTENTVVFISRKIAIFIRPADECFARWTDKQRIAKSGEAAKDLRAAQNSGDSFFRSRCRDQLRCATLEFRRGARGR